MGVVKHWNGLPRAGVDASSLKTFKVMLDEALIKLVWLKVSQRIARCWTRTFQPKVFYGSMKCQ